MLGRGQAGPSSFGRQQRLSEIKPIKIGGGQDLGPWGPVPPGPNIEPPADMHGLY